MSTLHPRWPAEVTDGSVAADCLIAGDSEEDEEEEEDEDEGDNKNNEDENEHDGYSE